MSWQTNMTWQLAKSRADLFTCIRSFFAERNITEVDTPLLSSGTITDVHIDPIKAKFSHSDLLAQDFYLQTSPEFAMKRLLASGYGDIFQLCKAFRDEPNGRFHNPEFTLLEWYRLGFDHFALMSEVSELLCLILQCEAPIKITYQEAFETHLGINPLTITRDACLAKIKQLNVYSDWLSNEPLDTLLQFLFSTCIEEKIGREVPCFVYHYPVSQASLAKVNVDDPSVANRFECFYKGIELLNGFEELTNAEQQLERFKKDNVIRQNNNQPSRVIDEQFIAALTHGLPACAGVALGIDRLLMLKEGIDNIDEVLTFNIVNA